MRVSVFLAAIAASAANAHYQFPALIGSNGVTTGQFQYVRETTNHYSNGPVTDVTSDQIKCYELNPGNASSTYSVAAGSTVGFQASPAIYHPGPLQMYMAKVPSGSTFDNWDGSGSVWFKVYEDKAIITSSSISWPNQGDAAVNLTIPKSLPSGNYFLRVEQIGLHVASTSGGAQFYLSCAQLSVTGGGSGSPSPLVAFPGAYKATDPGILINIYNPVPQNYTNPGPTVWSG